MTIRRIFGKPLMNLAQFLLERGMMRSGGIVHSIARRIRWNKQQRAELSEAWTELRWELRKKGLL